MPKRPSNRKAIAKRDDTLEREQRVAVLAAELSDDVWYQSSSAGPVRIMQMPIPHAANALRKLEGRYGDDVDATPLGQALARRIAQAGADSDVEIAEGVRMMRGTSGQFTGAIHVHYKTKGD